MNNRSAFVNIENTTNAWSAIRHVVGKQLNKTNRILHGQSDEETFLYDWLIWRSIRLEVKIGQQDHGNETPIT